jgi:hypothetical protein
MKATSQTIRSSSQSASRTLKPVGSPTSNGVVDRSLALKAVKRSRASRWKQGRVACERGTEGQFTRLVRERCLCLDQAVVDEACCPAGRPYLVGNPS